MVPFMARVTQAHATDHSPSPPPSHGLAPVATPPLLLLKVTDTPPAVQPPASASAPILYNTTMPLILPSAEVPHYTVNPSVLTPLLNHNIDTHISVDEDSSVLSDAPPMSAPSPDTITAPSVPLEEPALQRSPRGRSDTPKEPYLSGSLKPPKQKPKNKQQVKQEPATPTVTRPIQHPEYIDLTLEDS
ncbi:hypothetical protein DXG01_008411 [Tephrocybe rancida]|nr:hypothetical protein DXG01_008411 [Tephrocybe rancida]